MEQTTQPTFLEQLGLQNLSQEAIGAIVVAALIVLLVGFLLGRMGRGQKSETEKDAQQELQAYKESVSQHFGKTADLIDNLTQSYKDVFDHLGDSAKDLLTEEQVKKHLAARATKAVTLSYLDNDDKTASAVEADAETADAEVSADTPSDAEKTEKVEENSADNTADEATKADSDTDDKAGDSTDEASQEKPAPKSNEEKSADILNEVAEKISKINEAPKK